MASCIVTHVTFVGLYINVAVKVVPDVSFNICRVLTYFTVVSRWGFISLEVV